VDVDASAFFTAGCTSISAFGGIFNLFTSRCLAKDMIKIKIKIKIKINKKKTRQSESRFTLWPKVKRPSISPIRLQEIKIQPLNLSH
jgi:hypothetical protein